MPHVRERDEPDADGPKRPVLGGAIPDDGVSSPETSLAAREAEADRDGAILEGGAEPQVDADLTGDSDVPVIGRAVDDGTDVQADEATQPPDDDT